MKIKYLRTKHWLLMSLGGLLGITLGCERPDMYGCPEGPFDDSVVSKFVPEAQYEKEDDVIPKI